MHAHQVSQRHGHDARHSQGKSISYHRGGYLDLDRLVAVVVVAPWPRTTWRHSSGSPRRQRKGLRPLHPEAERLAVDSEEPHFADMPTQVAVVVVWNIGRRTCRLLDHLVLEPDFAVPRSVGQQKVVRAPRLCSYHCIHFVHYGSLRLLDCVSSAY